MNSSVFKKNNVNVIGNENAEQTIVFGHGFGMDQSAWRFVTGSFADQYRIILYDNVGGGKSDLGYFNQSKYARLESYANDVVDVCHVLELKNAIFVGHSVSGIVGMLASIKAPEIFSRLVFMNASPRYLNDHAAGYIGGFEKKDLLDLYRMMAENYFAWIKGFSALTMGNPDRPHLAEEFARTLSEVRPDVAMAVSKAIFESDHRNDLQYFNKPSLIIQSTQDIAVPMEVGAYLHRHLKNSRLSIINSTGHFPHISSPFEIIREVQAFLAA